MTPQQIQLVKSSWAKVLPIKEQAAALFYNKLFELDPSLKSLFKGDMQEQGRKLMAMINTAVNALDKIDAIAPAVQDLGRRHVNYGVQEKDYDTVGNALIWTLEQGLGPAAFNASIKEAWVAVYSLLADAMKEAAAMEPA